MFYSSRTTLGRSYRSPDLAGQTHIVMRRGLDQTAIHHL
jgi:hypothetical protein